MINIRSSLQVKADFTGLAIERCKSGVQRIVAQAAYGIETSMKEEILSGEKTGRIYTRKSVAHRASAPGESPANDLGDLVNSIGTEIGDNEATVTVDGGVAAYLEFGTVHMAPRPFVTPAADEAEQKLQKDLAALRLVGD